MTVAMQADLVPLPGPPVPPGPPQFVYAPTLALATCQPILVPDIITTLFGGGTMNLPRLPRTPDQVEMLGKGLQMLGMQMTPMAPGIVVMKTAAALLNLAKNMPTDIAQAIAFNPAPLVSDVTAVISAGSDLVALSILPLQMAKMIRGGLQMLIGYLQAMKALLIRLIARYTNINALLAKATQLGNAALLANATCAKERLDAKVSAVNDFLAMVGVALILLSVILCFVTGGHLDPLPGPLDASALVAEIFDPPIAVLQIILDAIPDLSAFALTC